MNEVIQPELRIISLFDGKVDLSKFEIEIYRDRQIYKIIRIENQETIKRSRPVYSGPE